MWCGVVCEEPTVAVGAVGDVDGRAGGGAVPPGRHSIHGDGVVGGRLQVVHLGGGLGARHRELFDVTAPTCRGGEGAKCCTLIYFVYLFVVAFNSQSTFSLWLMRTVKKEKGTLYR